MTPSEQIEALQTMVSRRVMMWVPQLAFVVALGLAAGGILTWHPVFFMLLFPALLIASLSARIRPHILSAATAFSSGATTHGQIEITATEGIDELRYHAIVQVSQPNAWRIQFNPMGWKPVAGIQEATIFTLPDVAWPALVQVSEGIIFPCQKPTRVGSR